MATPDLKRLGLTRRGQEHVCVVRAKCALYVLAAMPIQRAAESRTKPIPAHPVEWANEVPD